MPLGLCYGVFVDAGEPHRDAVRGESPELLDQAIVQLPDPLTGEERLDLLAAVRKLDAVPPAAVRSVG